MPITSKSSKFKGATQHYEVKLPKLVVDRHNCSKIQQVPGILGTHANSSPALILKDAAILILKQFKIFMYVSVSKCKWVSGVDTYQDETAAYSVIWEVFARKSADIHESSLLIL